MSENQPSQPLPALTASQRYHFDVYGYVVIENTLTATETEALYQALHGLKREILAADDPTKAHVRGAFMDGDLKHTFGFGHIIESMHDFLMYYGHPRLVAMTEEVVGGTVRLSEAEAIINSRDPQKPVEDEPQYGFHRGTKPGFGTHEVNGLFHCTFVKILTNLTELGPDDGGTVVIAGSHKIEADEADMIALAYQDRSIIHQVVAPAGSTLLFAESLIHATGQIRSDRERTIIIGGYAPTMFQAWNEYEPSAGFIEGLPEHLRPLFSGSRGWEHWQERHRCLGETVTP